MKSVAFSADHHKNLGKNMLMNPALFRKMQILNAGNAKTAIHDFHCVYFV